MFSYVIDVFVVKKYTYLKILCPLEFFENRTLKWVAFLGFWINIIFFILFLHFAPRGTTNNPIFLKTQNLPTLLRTEEPVWRVRLSISYPESPSCGEAFVESQT